MHDLLRGVELCGLLGAADCLVSTGVLVAAAVLSHQQVAEQVAVCARFASWPRLMADRVCWLRVQLMAGSALSLSCCRRGIFMLVSGVLRFFASVILTI